MYLKTERCTEGSGRMTNAKAMEYRFGPMGLSMKAYGVITKQMERVSSGTPMGMSTMESGRMIKLMVMGYTPTSTGLSMKDSGRMIFNMEEE
jgi:hypothetical protein